MSVVQATVRGAVLDPARWSNLRAGQTTPGPVCGARRARRSRPTVQSADSPPLAAPSTLVNPLLGEGDPARQHPQPDARARERCRGGGATLRRMAGGLAEPRISARTGPWWRPAGASVPRCMALWAHVHNWTRRHRASSLTSPPPLCHGCSRFESRQVQRPERTGSSQSRPCSTARMYWSCRLRQFSHQNPDASFGSIS